MKKNNLKCAICNTEQNYTVLYKQNYKDDDFNVSVFSARRLPDKIHYQLVKCNKCSLVRSTPIISNDILNDLYKESKLTYNDEVDNLVKTYVENLLPILNKLPKSAKILEIGCGNGFILEALYRMGYKNVFGVEPSTDAVAKAPKVIKNKVKVDYFKSSLFKAKSFDLVFIFQTLDHIPNPNQFLKDSNKILKSGGYLFAYNHDVESLSAKVFGEKSPIFDIEHTFLYSDRTIRKLFVKNKFIVESVKKPLNTLSLKHLLWLVPLPKNIKEKLLKKNFPFFKLTIKVPLGNLAITARRK